MIQYYLYFISVHDYVASKIMCYKRTLELKQTFSAIWQNLLILPQIFKLGELAAAYIMSHWLGFQ